MASASPETENTGDDIVVQGYSTRYTKAVKELLGIEGGWVNDPVDRGGATKYGISLRFLVAEGAIDLDADGNADFDLDMDGDIDAQDIRKLTRGDAVFLYHRCFWSRIGAEQLPKPIGEMLFDQAVNGGLSAAFKLMQRALNTCLLSVRATGRSPAMLRVDGAFGTKSKFAIDHVLRNPELGTDKLVEAYRDAVRERYRAIVRANPSQQRFLRGWLARAELLGR